MSIARQDDRKGRPYYTTNGVGLGTFVDKL